MTDGGFAAVRAVRRHLDSGWPKGSGAPRVLSWESRPWASATFTGVRLRFDCGVAMEGPDLKRLIRTLDNADFTVPGHVLVDLRFIESRTYDPLVPGEPPYTLATFEALVLEDVVHRAATERC